MKENICRKFSLFTKNDILDYSFYDENKNYIVILDLKKLEKIFGTNYIYFEENGGDKN